VTATATTEITEAKTERTQREAGIRKPYLLCVLSVVLCASVVSVLWDAD